MKKSRTSSNLAGVIALVAAAALTLSACGGGSDDDQKDSDSDARTLKVALSTADQPSSYLDENDDPAGFMPELIQAIADDNGFEIEWVAAPSDSHIPNIANGTYDTGTVGALVTPERQEQVNFTTPIQFASAVIVSSEDVAIEEFSEASGTIGAASDALVSALEENAPDAEVRKFEDPTAAMNALKAGQIDGVVLGMNPARAEQDKDDSLVLSDAVTTGQVAIAISKDDDELLKAFDDSLAKLAADGTLAKLFLDTYGYETSTDMDDAYTEFSR